MATCSPAAALLLAPGGGAVLLISLQGVPCDVVNKGNCEWPIPETPAADPREPRLGHRPSLQAQPTRAGATTTPSYQKLPPGS